MYRGSDEDLARRLQEQEERRPESPTSIYWSRGRGGAEPPPAEYYRSPEGRGRNVAMPHTVVRDPFDYSSPNFRREVRGMPTDRVGRSFRAPYTPPERPIPVSRRFSAFGSDSSRSLRRMEEELLVSPPPRRLVDVERSFERNDLELARRMQDLEDRGMGRLNSGRDLVDLEEDGCSEGGAGERVLRTGLHPNPNDFEALAQLISESGTNMNELSDEVLNELLGSNHGKKPLKSSQMGLFNGNAPLHNSGVQPLSSNVDGLEGARLEPPTGLVLKSSPASSLRPLSIPDKALAARMLQQDEKPIWISSHQSQSLEHAGASEYRLRHRACCCVSSSGARGPATGRSARGDPPSCGAPESAATQGPLHVADAAHGDGRHTRSDSPETGGAGRNP
jgi:hypothetical protein